jgi:hypothetical protein
MLEIKDFIENKDFYCDLGIYLCNRLNFECTKNDFGTICFRGKINIYPDKIYINFHDTGKICYMWRSDHELAAINEQIICILLGEIGYDYKKT